MIDPALKLPFEIGMTRKDAERSLPMLIAALAGGLLVAVVVGLLLNSASGSDKYASALASLAGPFLAAACSIAASQAIEDRKRASTRSASMISAQRYLESLYSKFNLIYESSGKLKLHEDMTSYHLMSKMRDDVEDMVDLFPAILAKIDTDNVIGLAGLFRLQRALRRHYEPFRTGMTDLAQNYDVALSRQLIGSIPSMQASIRVEIGEAAEALGLAISPNGPMIPTLSQLAARAGSR